MSTSVLQQQRPAARHRSRRRTGALDGGADRSEIARQTGVVLGVTGASLAVEQGTISVLMGLSGSGKSTLLRAANGLNRVTRGHVLVRDGRARRMSRIAPRARSATSAAPASRWCSSSSGCCRGGRCARMSPSGSSCAARRGPYRRASSTSGWRWSGSTPGPTAMPAAVGRHAAARRAGARPRHRADILLMDEPFSALDPPTARSCRTSCSTCTSRCSKTIVFVSHDLDEALSSATRSRSSRAGGSCKGGGTGPAHSEVRTQVT